MKKLFFSAILLAVIASCQSTKKAIFYNMPMEEFVQIEADSSVQILDVRTPEEFSLGHLKNALNANVKDDNFENIVSKLDKKKTVYVYCRSGVRSETASALLLDLGFQEVVNIQGGYQARQVIDSQ